jgi:osmoprotectant transport system permease protein
MREFLQTYSSEILLRTGEHLLLVSVAMLCATLIAVPLGILIARRPRLAQPVLLIANSIQTIPSLALFGFLITVPLLGGIGKTPAIVALTLYALLPIIQSTYTAMVQIPKGLKEAGKALGMNDGKILGLIEIPLALPILLAGIRVSTVICVGIATIAAAIGGGGLGVFIFRGISTVNHQLILAGAIPSALIALLADGGISLLEKILKQPRVSQTLNRRKRAITLGIVGLISFLTLSNFLINTILDNSKEVRIVIGSKNFTEQVILGELMAQVIEEKSNIKVDRKLNLGGTFICHEAVKAGEVDGYVEYTGTALTAILKEKPLKKPKEVLERVRATYGNKFNLEVFPPLGFNNTFAILIRQEDADKYQIKSLSDAAKYTPRWQAGFGHEFLAREDGYLGLIKNYNLKFSAPPQAMELGLMYRALAEKQVDLVAGNSTDGLITVLNLFILEDDRQFFPPYEAVPVFNRESLQKHPQLKGIIEILKNLISAQDMQQMNYEVDNQSRPVERVVTDFLKKKKVSEIGIPE